MFAIGALASAIILLPSQVLMITISILLLFVFIGVLFLATVWMLAPADKFWTKIETGDIKLVDKNGECVRVLANIPGKIVRNKKIVDAPGNTPEEKERNAEREKTWLQRRFNIYWVGIYPLYRIKVFYLVKEREKADLTPDTPAHEWIEVEDAQPMTALRWRFPFPVLVPNIEFAGSVQGTLLALCNCEVTEPETLIYVMKAKFFNKLRSEVRSVVQFFCQGMVWQIFLDAVDKTDSGGMSDDVTPKINHSVETGPTKLGLRLASLSITMQDSSDKKFQRASQAEQVAILQGNAEVAKAKKHAEAEGIRATAEMADMVQAVKDLIAAGVPPEIAAKQVSPVATMRRLADTNLIAYGNSGVVTNPGDQNKNKKTQNKPNKPKGNP
jgi:hypothetical protein